MRRHLLRNSAALSLLIAVLLPACGTAEGTQAMDAGTPEKNVPSGINTPEWTATPGPSASEWTAIPMPALEVVVLTDVLQEFEECRSAVGVEAGDNTYSFSCSHSADTGYTVSITRFDNEVAAHTQFEAYQGNNPVSCFQGYDLVESSSKNPYKQFIVQEHLYWQAGSRIVSIYASYDYGYFHFTARSFVEVVYAAGVEHDLFLAGECPISGIFPSSSALPSVSRVP